MIDNKKTGQKYPSKVHSSWAWIVSFLLFQMFGLICTIWFNCTVFVSFHTGLFTENPSGNEEGIIALVAQYVNETILPKKLASFEIISATQPTADDVQASIKGTVERLFCVEEECNLKYFLILNQPNCKFPWLEMRTVYFSAGE